MVAAYDFSKSYELLQDADTGLYFMELFVGSKLEKVDMLIDTQANGTAIDYNYGASRMAIAHKSSPGYVEMPDGYA